MNFTASQAADRPHLSVVLPAYNESKALEASIPRLSQFLDSLERSYEIIVADDGSKDGTPLLPWDEYRARYHAAYLPAAVNGGKGDALRRGFAASRGVYVFFTDADLPIGLEGLRAGLAVLEAGQADMVIGDRQIPASRAEGSAVASRHLASRIFNWGVQLLLLPGFADTQCCLKGFSQAIGQQFAAQTSTQAYAIDVEMLYIARKSGYRIQKMPVTWMDSRSNMPLSAGLRIMLREMGELLAIRRRHG